MERESARLLHEGLLHLQRGQFAAAREALTRARALRPRDSEAALALGIACYRLDDLGCAEQALRQAVATNDPEVAGSARVFLGLCLRAAGAVDQARRELDQARRELARAATPGVADLGVRSGASPALGADLLDGLAEPRRLTAMLSLAAELDGNVPLTDLSAWRGASSDSVDGDLLFSGSLALRPLRRVGLSILADLSYRQQLRPNPSGSAMTPRFQDYNLLLVRGGAAYSHLTDRNRLRVQVGGSFTNLAGSSLFWEVGGRAYDRIRLISALGVALSYDGRYRDYINPTFAAFSGHSHTLQAELSYGTAPRPVSAALSYQLLREELRAPADATFADFRAWAHGPMLRVRAQVHPRLELVLLAALLRRRFDESFVTQDSARRSDWFTSADLTGYIDCTRFLDAFVGAGVIYNQSSVDLYTFIKPTASAGLVATFTAL